MRRWTIGRNFWRTAGGSSTAARCRDGEHPPLPQRLLRQYSGCIGYGERPIERGKRYATPLLQLSRGYHRQLEPKWGLPGCDLQNGGTRRTIERDGRLDNAFGSPTPTGKRHCSTGSRYKQAPFYRVPYRRRERWVSHPPHRVPPHFRFFRSQRPNQSNLTGIFALAQAHSGARR